MYISLLDIKHIGKFTFPMTYLLASLLHGPIDILVIKISIMRIECSWKTYSFLFLGEGIKLRFKLRNKEY